MTVHAITSGHRSTTAGTAAALLAVDQRRCRAPGWMRAAPGCGCARCSDGPRLGPHRPRRRSQRAGHPEDSPAATPRPSARSCATRSPPSTTPGGTSAHPTHPRRTRRRHRRPAPRHPRELVRRRRPGRRPARHPRIPARHGWRPARGTGIAADHPSALTTTDKQASHDHQSRHRDDRRSDRRAASPPPATTYEQAQATYRCTIDARERFEELDNRDLSARARHAPGPRHLRPATARRRRQVPAADRRRAPGGPGGRRAARPPLPSPRAACTTQSGRRVVAADRRRNRLRRGNSPAGLPGVGRRPAPPARRLRGQIRPGRCRARRRAPPGLPSHLPTLTWSRRPGNDPASRPSELQQRAHQAHQRLGPASADPAIRHRYAGLPCRAPGRRGARLLPVVGIAGIT